MGGYRGLFGGTLRRNAAQCTVVVQTYFTAKERHDNPMKSAFQSYVPFAAW